MRTFNSFSQRIQMIFASWHSWSGADVHDGPMANTQPVTISDAIAHGTHVDSFLTIATSIRDSEGFAQWAKAPENSDQAADLDEFITEMQTAKQEFSDATHHENVWKNLGISEKQRLTHGTLIDVDLKKQLNARVQLKKLQPKK